MLQIIAMFTMLIDHLGFVFFDKYPILRIIGRIALPLYCYGVAIGFIYTKDNKKYLLRMAIIAFIAQIPFMLAFKVIEANVIVTLFIGLLCLYLIQETKNKYLSFFIVLFLMVVSLVVPMDYGLYAVLLVMIYHFLPKKYYLLAHFFLNIIYIYLGIFPMYQLFSLVGTVVILFEAKMPKIKTNKYFYRSFYPLHLLIIALIARL